jgi:hypothetical protein
VRRGEARSVSGGVTQQLPRTVCGEACRVTQDGNCNANDGKERTSSLILALCQHGYIFSEQSKQREAEHNETE